jgi:hypothetical protein
MWKSISATVGCHSSFEPPQMDSESVVLSNSELTTVIGALLEPHENPEIGQARLLIASKFLGTSTSGPSSVHVSVRGHFSNTAAAPQAQVH